METNSCNDIKLMKHGNWNFEYNSTSKSDLGKCNIFCTDIESIDQLIFKQNKHNIQSQLSEKVLEDFRRASAIHKIARKKAVSMIYTGARLADLVNSVEDIILRLCKQDPSSYFIKGSNSNNVAGIAFPIGVNINNVVAHDTKTKAILDDRKFSRGDVVKIDIGVHINGHIIDSALTHIVTDKPGIHDHENIYNSVLDASRESMFIAIKMAGSDQRLHEISESISEIIKSYEVDIGSETIPIKPVQGIGGHNINQYQIHGGKLILSEPDQKLQRDTRMEEGEIYGIETFASTGYGIMTQNTEMDKCTHFMEAPYDEIESDKSITKKDKKYFRQSELYNWLKTRRGLPFSSSWLDYKNIPKLEKISKLGIQTGQLIAFPPLHDEVNSVVAQFEHTICVNDGSIEIFSLGEDY